jgi:hypothetical protein
MQSDHFAGLSRQLWEDWFGATLPEHDGASAEPELLAQLRAVERDVRVFGFQNQLLDRQVPNEAGVVPVIAENQSVWTIGYRPDGTDAPDAVVFAGPMQIVHEVSNGLAELLYRTSVIEAIFAGWNRMGIADEPSAAAALSPYEVVPAMRVESTFDLPAVWALGDVLVMGFGEPSEYVLYAGARDLSAFDRSVLPQITTWSEWDRL